MAKHNLSSQDVRNKLIQLRDSLVQNLEFITDCIDADYKKLRAYYEKYGDLQYRPVLSRTTQGDVMLGEPTELVIEPLAGKYRATINSLLQSIRLIESEILPEDNPEGSTASSNTKPEDLTQKRASLRDQFKAAPSAETIIPTELVESSNIGSIRSNTAAIESEPKAPSESMPQPKPWRTQTQRKFVPKSTTDVAKEPVEKAPIQDKPVSLENPERLDPESERLRNELRGLKAGGSMARMREKYGKK